MNQAELLPDPSDGPRFCAYVRSLPYDKRWDALRPVLEPLFHTESIKDIAKMMLDRYQFNANETQYKYRFNKVWKLQKNVPEVVKEAALRKGNQRAKEGKQSIAKYRGRPIPASRFRLANDLPARISSKSLRDLFTFPLDKLDMFGRYTPFGNNLLLAWNMPFGTQPSTRHVLSPHHDSPSFHSAQMGNTPVDLEMTTPSEHAGSPMNALITTRDSPNLIPAIREQRVRLFLEGKLPELLKALSQQERSDLSQYMYDFWHFSFASAQNWSPYWTPAISHTSTVKSPARAPRGNTDAETYSLASPALVDDQPLDAPSVSQPSQVCGWAIHIANPEAFFDINWVPSDTTRSSNQPHRRVVELDEEMRTVLESSSFTNIPPSDLAVPLPDLISKVRPYKHELFSEAISFAIMGRNLELLRTLLCKVEDELHGLFGYYKPPPPDELKQLFVDMNLSFTQLLHLATTYVDGGATCCLIINELAQTVVKNNLGLGDLLNDNRHTLIDNLLLTVLRNHSRAPLNVIDQQLSKAARFSGQEVDICGRWSATSVCFQSLVASGEDQIPGSWKHKFCRTSAQAICHALTSLLRYFPLVRKQDSGLFSTRCINAQCGKLFTLSPLHAVAMTGFHLINGGAQDEDLFGILACYLCLVDAGVDPLVQKEIAASQVLGIVNDETCDHRPQTAAEFARDIFDKMYLWDVSNSCFTGFAVLLAIMDETEQAAKDIRQLREEVKQYHGELFNDRTFEKSMWIFNGEEDEQFLGEEDSEVNSIMAEQGLKRELLSRSFGSMCIDGSCGISCDYILEGKNFPAFGNSTKLGHIWASVQAEFTSSEGRGVEEQYLSRSFDMQKLLESLRSDSKPDIGHLQNGTLNDYCRCGKFDDAVSGLATREKVFIDPSHSLGDDVELWSQASFIENVELSELLYID